MNIIILDMLLLVLSLNCRVLSQTCRLKVRESSENECNSQHTISSDPSEIADDDEA